MMKQYYFVKRLLFLSACLIHFGAFAQDVVIKKETIYKDGEPFARILKSGSIIHDFSIRTLDDEEILAAIHQGDGREYTITFMASGAKATMQGGFSFAKTLAKELVISKIIKDGKLNPDGERRFLLLHPADNRPDVMEPYTETSPVILNEEEQPARLRTAPIMVFGNKISQDSKTIGAYKTSSGAANGTTYQVITIYSPAGSTIAEVTIEGAGAKSGRIVTTYNRKTATITFQSLDEMGRVKEISAWLVANRDL